MTLNALETSRDHIQSFTSFSSGMFWCPFFATTLLVGTILGSVGSFPFWILRFVSSIMEISLRWTSGQHLLKVQEAPKDEVVDTQVQAVGDKQLWDFWFKHNMQYM